MPRVKYLNITPQMVSAVHGYHEKDLFVLHETISSDIPGWNDILNNVAFLDREDWGCHGFTDAEGHKAWTLGLGKAIFYHAGGVNTRAIGFEQVSKVPLVSPNNATRRYLWSLRQPQLRATAQLMAAVARAQGKPLSWIKYSNGDTPGITTHWSVSQRHPESDGHSDCRPVHLGGYYPALQVVQMTRGYYAAGYHL